jgi:predicted kinase
MATNKPELIILRGLQASGKSTWAHGWVAQDRKNRVRINKDDLRLMIDKSVYTNVTEGRIIAARDVLVKGFLIAGVSVVVDDTNLKMFHVKKLARIAHQGGWDWSVKDFDTDLETCIKRDLARHPDGYIGAPIITDTYNRFLRGKTLGLPKLEDLENTKPGDVELYVPDISQPEAIIIDIDGTVALKGTRSPFDESRVHEDRPNEAVIEAVWGEIELGTFPIFCSGRTAGCRIATLKWLHDNIFLHLDSYQQPFELYMRAEGDNRKDSVVKMELFNKHIRHHYNVRRVYDDRQQVVDMWRSLGLTVMQVAPGQF